MKYSIILAFFISIAGCTSVQSSLCEIRGGDAHINLGGYQYCAKKFNDGGKQCTDSSQCDGVCYLPWNFDPKSNSPLVGKCATSEIDVNQPCYYIANGKAEMGACIEE